MPCFLLPSSLRSSRRVLSSRGDDVLEVRPPDDGKQPLFFHLQSLVAALPGVIVKVRLGVRCWGCAGVESRLEGVQGV